MDQNKHRKMPIRLDDLSKESGFSVPENYFNDSNSSFVPKNVWETISTETYFIIPEEYFDNLPQLIQKRIAPKGTFDWSKVWKEGFYAVPKGYFEDLPYRIAERIKRKKSFVLDWKLVLTLLSPRFSMPLAIGCFMIGYVVFQVFERKMDTSIGLKELSNESIQEYLIENQLVHDEQVAEIVSSSKIKDLESIVPNSVTKEEMEENIDVSGLDESSI